MWGRRQDWLAAHCCLDVFVLRPDLKALLCHWQPRPMAELAACKPVAGALEKVQARGLYGRMTVGAEVPLQA